ncbi:putative ALA-interacting subunit 4 isoform X2 [Hordeum vulgare subsp. vulgare]|nr:putative ALA-interacting subunit 4 isoform X2 [Hordeum vulgare subsp. vulgare]
MKGPIHVYYQLENYYQNHRRYVKSRSDQQLRDKDYKDTSAVTKSCDPEATTGDGSLIVPCGLIAWSLFNDTYAFSVNKKSVTVNKKDIAWPSDKNSKFGSNVFPVNFQKGGLIGGGNLNDKLPLSEQEDLIVWMRTAALPTFRKLYGRIEADIMASDEITVVIQNNYNTYSFGGSKAVVLSTASWMGGKNNFIGVAYVAVGGICLLLAMGFVVLYVVKPRYMLFSNKCIMWRSFIVKQQINVWMDFLQDPRRPRVPVVEQGVRRVLALNGTLNLQGPFCRCRCRQ